MATKAGTGAARLALAAMLLAMLAGELWPRGVLAEDICADPRNKTFNCQFDSFGPAPGGSVPKGWWPFVISGAPAFDQASDTPKPPSLRIWSDGGTFVAGIYQVVRGITPGATYEAFIGWAVFASSGDRMGRVIGIDPRGGTDPTASSIVWSPEVWEKKRSNPELRVRAVAEADSLTVFVRVDHPASYGADQAFLDAVTLVQDDSVPIAPPASATATETSTPVPEPTTVEPTAVVETPTAALPATLSDDPIASPGTATPSVTATGTPTVTLTPTPSPSPTGTAAATPTVTAVPVTPTHTAPAIVYRLVETPLATGSVDLPKRLSAASVSAPPGNRADWRLFAGGVAIIIGASAWWGAKHLRGRRLGGGKTL